MHPRRLFELHVKTYEFYEPCIPVGGVEEIVHWLVIHRWWSEERVATYFQLSPTHVHKIAYQDKALCLQTPTTKCPQPETTASVPVIETPVSVTRS